MDVLYQLTYGLEPLVYIEQRSWNECSWTCCGVSWRLSVTRVACKP